MPGDMMAMTPGVLTVQTQRNVGHLVRWQGSALGSSASTASGVVADFSGNSSQHVFVAGQLNVRTGFLNDNLMGGCFIGHVIVCAAFHDLATIEGIEQDLHQIWGI